MKNNPHWIDTGSGGGYDRRPLPGPAAIGRNAVGTVYGEDRPDPLNTHQQAMYDQVAEAAQDLRGQLRELVQIAKTSSYPDDVEAVRGALFRAHGYQRDGVR